MLEIKEMEKNLVCVLIKGELEESKTRGYTEQCYNAIEQGFIHFEFDMKDVSYMDSTGLSFLVTLYKKLERRGGSLFVFNLPGWAVPMFTVSRLYNRFCKRPDGGND